MKVQFLFHEKENDLFALFPDEKYDHSNLMSYSHIGQHSGCSKEYAFECRNATKEEYKQLKIELEELGYEFETVKK